MTALLRKVNDVELGVRYEGFLKRRTIRTEVDKIAAAAVEGDVSDLPGFFKDTTGTAVVAPAREEKLGFRSNSIGLSGGGQTKLFWSPKQDKS